MSKRPSAPFGVEGVLDLIAQVGVLARHAHLGEVGGKPPTLGDMDMPLSLSNDEKRRVGAPVIERLGAMPPVNDASPMRAAIVASEPSRSRAARSRARLTTSRRRGPNRGRHMRW